jgi:glycosyltransferase involved in cell wall biosynthesis
MHSSEPQTATTPLFFSVVIPTYNRSDRLHRCLVALSEQTYPRSQFEVIVVDDGSQTSMQPVVAEVSQVLNIHLIRQTNAGPAAARNAGAALAQGRYLAFTDDDCAPLPDWLEQFAQQFVQTPDGLLGGYTLNGLETNPFSAASQLLIDYLYSYYNDGQASFFASNNLALPRQVFLSLGGFDRTFPLAAGEDRELCDRIAQQGYPMQAVPAAQIRHYHALSLAKFWQQHFNYGRGAYHFHQVRADRMSAPIKVEPLTFYINLIAHPHRQSLPQSAWLLALLMFLSQVANVVGFFWGRAAAGKLQAGQRYSSPAES